jgi:hypothetical protein
MPSSRKQVRAAPVAVRPNPAPAPNGGEWLSQAGLRHIARGALARTQRHLNFAGEHRFTDRRRRGGTLVLLLAGYKPHLWPYTLARLERLIPDDADVCVVSSGKESPELDALAARHGWSRLITRRNAVALAQNLAILHHPDARFIHKLDEDILLADGYFGAMAEGFDRVKRDGRFTPGFCAPVLNVNGFSYRLFLETLGLEDAYAQRFGELRQAGEGNLAQSDGQAALWLWRQTVPFDETARRFAEAPFGYSAVPHRFSIGAILFERDLWEEIGGLVVMPWSGLGHDEKFLCKECTDRSRVGIVLHDVLAGHFSFGPQDAVMQTALPELEAGLRPTAVA